ncbi:DNA mismatch repair endonuclease MutL [Candidatus Galacturonibacter soehngenii]|uniref:DNA mismatch repair protein MutL n=1 Tax=Candidatus Galacturonatibacter soehngenii TaxID=2307010 RepID=A0A7V7QM15_9FIRM|nr:DNA mismatch repair endonuclease MutL [Candidatus Galacturonibacter soehngenii]KAB1439624.1 DNA mismatch repair endonuclease MutL [Candidatus Galacturonibacter soehngenii]
MPNIALLDQNTIDKIAAGEVIERPASVVKELVENAIDAKASAVTVEIKEGGISFIRITDNGCGIPKEEAALAFLRHSTSKIKSVEDLLSVSSLGFRGEALSSIAAVSQVELITKTKESLMGVRYIIEGGLEKGLEDIGAPEGTTFLVRKLFYNTPARRKFLKSATTEASYINDLIERLALSHPDISFKFINNNQTKIHTSGNTNLKDIIYSVYGREIAGNLIEIDASMEGVKITGFIGKPVISRGNRNYENYYVNGRYVKSGIIAKAIEEGYKTFMMQHKYPFTALHFTIDGDLLDVNVHPTKMELRFSNQEEIYKFIFQTIQNGLTKRELIPSVSFSKEEKENEKQKAKLPPTPEPFETSRLVKEMTTSYVREEKPLSKIDMMFKEAANKYGGNKQIEGLSIKNPYELQEEKKDEISKKKIVESDDIQKDNTNTKELHESISLEKEEAIKNAQQLDLFEEKLLTKEAKYEHKIIGQVFDTYWIVQFHDKMYLIDQHAAHEKVLYERTMKSLKEKEHTSQLLSPPIILTLSMQEEELLKKYMEHFTNIGFEIEPFGGKEYSVRAVPGNLFSIAQKDLLIEMIDGLNDGVSLHQPDIIDEKIALMSCKAAVKGNNKLSHIEATALIDELLTLENPYNCPHGRPTIISMTKAELEKKFKRIV